MSDLIREGAITGAIIFPASQRELSADQLRGLNTKGQPGSEHFFFEEGSAEPVEIASVVFDAVTLEEAEERSRVSEHPIETGSDIADHIRKQPSVLSLRGWFTDTSLFDPGTSRSRTQLGRLFNFNALNTVLDIRSGIARYRNYVLELVAPRRSSGPRSSNRNAIEVSLRFKRVAFVNAQTLHIDPIFFAEPVSRSAPEETGPETEEKPVHEVDMSIAMTITEIAPPMGNVFSQFAGGHPNMDGASDIEDLEEDIYIMRIDSMQGL